MLPTEGKADVEVVILQDRDGYEICFVGDKGFFDLCKPTYDTIDWTDRKDCWNIDEIIFIKLSKYQIKLLY